jgi:Ala-tRNA(Pro) deacylase
MSTCTASLALIKDDHNKITSVIDASIMDDEQINFHPLVNTESTGLYPEELLAFIRPCEREAVLINFDEQPIVHETETMESDV